MLDRLRRRTPDPPGFDPNRVPPTPRRTTVDADAGRFSCHAVDSPDGRWTLAYGRRVGSGESSAFRLGGGDIDWSVPSTRPTLGTIANDGTTVLVERGESNTTTCRVRAFVDGTETLRRIVDATVTGVAIRPDGGLVAVATRRPDASVHAYDPAVETDLTVANGTHGQANDSVWTVTPRRATPRLLGFHVDGDRPLLYVARERRDDPYLAIDADGEVVWGSERYKSTQPFAARIRKWIR